MFFSRRLLLVVLLSLPPHLQQRQQQQPPHCPTGGSPRPRERQRRHAAAKAPRARRLGEGSVGVVCWGEGVSEGRGLKAPQLPPLLSIGVAVIVGVARTTVNALT